MRGRFFPGDVAFGVALAFVAGIFLAGLGWSPGVVISFAIVGAGVTFFWSRLLWRELILFILSLAVGLFYFSYYALHHASGTDLPVGVQLSFEGVVEEEPRPSERSLILSVGVRGMHSGRVKVFAPLGSGYTYGDLLRVRGAIQPPEEGGDAAVFSPEIALISRHNGFFLREWLIRLKLRILDEFRGVLEEDEAALLGGIAFGSKVSFSQALKDAMSRSGTTHLVAVSGYNITIVIAAAGGIFGRFLSRRLTFVSAIVFLCLFILMVGTEASAIRAAIMGCLALVARELGSSFSMRNAITFTAAGMSFLDPTAPTGSMSFILSFLSLMGIVYIGPPLRAMIGYNAEEGGLFDWKENAVTTLSAQLAVVPVLVHSFGRFSPVSIVANVLILATVPLTMFFGFALAMAGFISGHLSFLIGKLVGLLLAYQLSMIRFFSAIAVPLPLPFGSTFAMALYYMTLSIVALRHRDA